MKARCKECGAEAPVTAEQEQEMKNGYSVTLYCPNKRCENHPGGLAAFAAPDPEPRLEQGSAAPEGKT
jgi:hypothetical protein